MSLSVSVLVRYSKDLRFLKYTLRNSDPNAPSSPDLAFQSNKLIKENERVELQRGTLTSALDDSPVKVVCKFAYGRRALERLDNEARIYFNKLKHLQGKCIPHSYGYFIGDSEEGPTGCLVMDDCGEPLYELLQYVDPAFRDAVVEAVQAIHDAGVEHCDIDPRNILDCNGRPIIIDFESAEDHECQRSLPMVRDATEPSRREFKCIELYELGRTSNFWKPRFILYATGYFDVELAKDAHKLAAKAPRHWPPDYALQKAYVAIIKHAEEWYPDEYKAWAAKMDAKKKDSRSVTDKGPLAAAPIGTLVDRC